MSVSEKTFREIAIADPSGQWEYDCGRMRRKPPMTYAHNRTEVNLFRQLDPQIDPARFDLRMNAGHVHIPDTKYYIPDLFVIPIELTESQRASRDLETYDQPLPLVVEVWSRTTATYDVQAKLLEYQRRGDLEIWLIHPYDRTVTAWRRQSDGSYQDTVHTSGSIEISSLPSLTITWMVSSTKGRGRLVQFANC